MPQHVSRDALGVQGGAALGSRCGVLGEPVLDSVAGERAAATRGKERVGRAAGSLGEPNLEGRYRPGQQGRDPVLAPLAVAADVRAAAKVDVATGQASQLGGAEPRLDGQEQQRVVASTGAGRTVGTGQERIYLGASQEVDERAVEAFGRDGEHTL